MKRKLALFKNTKFNFIGVTEPIMEGNADYIRISEYVDVEFPEIIEPALDHASYDYE